VLEQMAVSLEVVVVTVKDVVVAVPEKLFEIIHLLVKEQYLHFIKRNK